MFAFRGQSPAEMEVEPESFHNGMSMDAPRTPRARWGDEGLRHRRSEPAIFSTPHNCAIVERDSDIRPWSNGGEIMPAAPPSGQIVASYEPPSHVHWPYVVSGYIQLLFNIVVVSGCIYLMFAFYSTVRNDIENKVHLFSKDVIEEIAKCSQDYRENRCDPSGRVPAMEQACRTWEACMNRDPYVVARNSKFTGETLGEAINGFFEVLEWKAIACIGGLFFGMLVCYNIAFSFARRKGPEQHYYAAPAPPPPAEFHRQSYPATPSRHCHPGTPHWG